jgi:putative oxidoreductase
MSRISSYFKQCTPHLLSLLRIAVALLFIEHGSEKLLGFPTSGQFAFDSLTPLMWVSAGMEFFGGLLILLGLFTRPVAFLLSGEMAVAYFMVHASQGFFPLENRGELAALYSFMFLFLAAAGGGTWSVDNPLWRRRRTRHDSATTPPKAKGPNPTAV